MSVLTSFTVVQPLRKLVQQAQRATAGEKGAVTPLARPITREIADLSHAVTTMAGHLEQRADYIRTFAAHVSHEFKTPLAAIRGAVELLRDHLETMTAAERERFLGNLDDDAARLERMVRRLLDLARADVLQAASSDRARVDEVIRRLAARYRELGLPVSVVEPLAASVAAINEDVLESILSNLLDNARQHGGAEVTVTVACADFGIGADAMLRISVNDDGPGVSAANATRVFEPFFTTARAQGGTGLGLAVVKSLLAAHGGAIELVAGVGGAQWLITVPLRSLEP